MIIRFRKSFFSAIVLSMLVGSLETQAMWNSEEGGKSQVHGSKTRGKRGPVRQRHEPQGNINNDPELPSQFMKENKASAMLRLEDSAGSSISDYKDYIQFFDLCFTQAKHGNAEAAELLSKFYSSLRPYPDHINESNYRSFNIKTYNIAKKFAKCAAEEGKPKEYIYLTALDYGAGKEMKEHTKWMIKDFLMNPSYCPEDPHRFLRLTNILEPHDMAPESLSSLERFIATEYHKRNDVRLTKANMLLKGFFGASDNNNERAFRIIGEVCHLKNTTDAQQHGFALQASGFLFYDLLKKHGYDADKDRRLQELGCGYSKEPLQVIQQSTRLLQYYKIVPEPIGKQLKNNKHNLCLDLHGKDKGKSVEEVMCLLNFMVTCNETQSLLIITGKGNHSPGHHPILKPFIKNLLDDITKDQTFSIGYKEDTGGGAFSVWKVAK